MYLAQRTINVYIYKTKLNIKLKESDADDEIIGNSQSRSTVFDVAGSDTAKTSRAFKIGPQIEVAVGIRSNVLVGPIE